MCVILYTMYNVFRSFALHIRRQDAMYATRMCATRMATMPRLAVEGD